MCRQSFPQILVPYSKQHSITQPRVIFFILIQFDTLWVCKQVKNVFINESCWWYAVWGCMYYVVTCRWSLVQYGVVEMRFGCMECIVQYHWSQKLDNLLLLCCQLVVGFSCINFKKKKRDSEKKVETDIKMFFLVILSIFYHETCRNLTC